MMLLTLQGANAEDVVTLLFKKEETEAQECLDIAQKFSRMGVQTIQIRVFIGAHEVARWLWNRPPLLPYSPPVLKHIGSVRKLTLAGTGPHPDFIGGRHHH